MRRTAAWGSRRPFNPAFVSKSTFARSSIVSQSRLLHQSALSFYAHPSVDEDDSVNNTQPQYRRGINTTTYHATNIITTLVPHRSYARKVINTSDSKFNVLREFWAEKGKRYLQYGFLGAAGVIFGLPIAIVGGTGYLVYTLYRNLKYRIAARTAGVSVAEYVATNRPKKEAKKPGFFTRLLHSAIATEMTFRAKCLELLNQNPILLTKLGSAIDLDTVKTAPSSSKDGIEEQGKHLYNYSSFYVKSQETGKFGLVRAVGCQDLDTYIKAHEKLAKKLLTPEGMTLMRAVASAWEMTELRVEIEDTGEEVVVVPDAQSRAGTTTKTTTFTSTVQTQGGEEEVVVEEVIEVVEERKGGKEEAKEKEKEKEETKRTKGRKKKKPESFIDVPFKPAEK